jgi:hypothetical protein
MGEKIKKDWYNGQKGKYEDKMILDTLQCRIIIRNNLAYLQEGILFVSLL